MVSNAQWVRAARAGNATAFGHLIEAAWPSSVRFARVVLADLDEAEDVVQDAVITAWHRLGELRDPVAFDGWLRTIVYRQALARMRGFRRWVSNETLVQDRAAPPNQRSGDVERALRALPPRQRAVVFLGEIDGRTDPEIARTLGIKPSTVRIHRMRARDKLRALLEEKADVARSG